MKKIKVVWVCSFSNSKVREYYKIKVPWLFQVVYKYLRKSNYKDIDRAHWNTFGLKEMERQKDIELHVISPVYFLSENEIRFNIKGIHYYFFKDENSSFIKQVSFRAYRQYFSEFKHNRRVISGLIKEIDPEIVHVIGAENPFYSLSALDIPKSKISIIQLQTLLNEVVYGAKNLSESRLLKRKCEVERAILKYVDYVGADDSLVKWVNYIQKNINSDCRFLPISLAVTEPLYYNDNKKIYDFVYFSFDISKAFDDALEAFAEAYKQNNNLTLNVVGGYSITYKKEIDEKIKKLSLSDVIHFEGRQESHEDVLFMIRKCRFALLPLAGDLISSTIREAMANGLPTVSVITEGGTSLLNQNRESILLSKRGDYLHMAKNMLKLVNDKEFEEKIRSNAFITASEYLRNEYVIQKWVEVYKECLDKK